MRLIPHVPLGLALSTILLLAQYSSSIEGIVTDHSAAVIPAASVNVTNIATGVVVRETLTSGEGFYRLVNLGPVQYRVTIEHTGFRASEQRNISLAPNEIVRVNVTLEGGAVGEKVTVEAEVPQVETEPGRVTRHIDAQQLKELPLNGRNLYSLAKYDGQDAPMHLEGRRLGGSQKVMASPWQFKQYGQSGRWVSELLPDFPNVVDHVTMLRSVTTDRVDHSTAQFTAMTGRGIAGYPSIGLGRAMGSVRRIRICLPSLLSRILIQRSATGFGVLRSSRQSTRAPK